MKHLIFLLSLISFSIYGQYSISGDVVDDQNQPIFYANVILYNMGDSSLVSGQITDEFGKFRITATSSGPFYLETSMLSYVSEISDSFTITKNAVSILNFTLAPDSKLLSTITIKGRRPLLEQKADKLIVNVENNLTSLNSNLLDVMRKIPGMIVVNGNLSLAGQSNMTILINGKTTRYMDVQSLLKDMPGDNISKVEIIHQPGAEYEASGSGPIINIILKKNNLFGTRGTVNLGIGKSYDWRNRAGISLSHYEGNVNIQGSASYTKNSWVEEISILRNIGNTTYDQTTVDPVSPIAYRAGMVLDWDITDNHRFNIGSQWIDSKTDKVAMNETRISDNFRSTMLNTDNVADRGWNLFSVNPNYTFTLDSSNTKIEVDVNIAQVESHSNNTLGIFNISDNLDILDQRFLQSGKTKILASMANYQTRISPSILVQGGAKYSMADLDNDLTSENEIEGDRWNKNTLQSNRFLFDETISALYGKLNYEQNGWTGTVGLRYEKSVSKGNSVTLDSSLDRTIAKLFPSFSIGKDIGSGLSTSLAYSYRIDRPSYSTLNPFVYYYDPYTYEKGNPSIRPELTHSAKFTLALEGQPFFNVEYKRSNDAMVEVTEQNDVSGETARLTVNLAQASTFTTSLFFPLDFVPKVSGYGGFMLNRQNYNSQYLGSQFNPTKWTLNAFTQVNFKLPGDINGEVSGFYSSGDQEGIIESEWIYGISMGFSKKIMKDKAQISVGIEDAFNKFWTGNINYANMQAVINAKWYSKMVNVNFSYKFGNQHIKSKSRKRGSASDALNRVNTNG